MVQTLAQTTYDGQADGDSAGLICTGLSKSYWGIPVLKGVDITLRPGSVVGLIGENGAGKSTTSSIIAGIVEANGGSMTIDGVPYEPTRPSDALKNGVALIHQEIRMVPELSVAENIFIGRLPRRRGVIDRNRINDEAREYLEPSGCRTFHRGAAGNRDRTRPLPRTEIHHF